LASFNPERAAAGFVGFDTADPSVVAPVGGDFEADEVGGRPDWAFGRCGSAESGSLAGGLLSIEVDTAHRSRGEKNAGPDEINSLHQRTCC
jgi:hypothetical protein